MNTEMERNSNRRECRTWSLIWEMVPRSKGAAARAKVAGTAAGTECAGRAEMSGIGAGTGVGVCALTTATVVTRCCARLRSAIRWLTRRLDVRARADGRAAGAVAGGTQSRYTSTVAKECSGSGLGVPREASAECPLEQQHRTLCLCDAALSTRLCRCRSHCPPWRSEICNVFFTPPPPCRYTAVLCPDNRPRPSSCLYATLCGSARIADRSLSC